MYVQYKVYVSENQVDTLKDAIRLKKGVTLCFPKGASGVIMHTKNQHGILMLNLSISKGMQRQTCRKLQGMDTFWR